MAKFVLASSSPRRKELMERIGLGGCEIIMPGVEEVFDGRTAPEDVVAEYSRKKADSVIPRCQNDAVIIAADTIVWHDGYILGKPSDEADALRMLSGLSGTWHSVYTGLTVRHGDQVITQEEITSVKMRDLNEDIIRRYIKTGEPMDKSGAYGIQGMGSILVERVDGDFFNVMGLPLYRLSLMLDSLGIDLMSYGAIR